MGETTAHNSRRQISREQVQVEHAVVHTFEAETRAVNERHPDQGLIASSQDGHGSLRTVPDHDCLVELEANPTAIGKPGAIVAHERQAKSRYRMGRKSKMAGEAGIHDGFEVALRSVGADDGNDQSWPMVEDPPVDH
jgi:hypothetical protein